jgi:signal transduction histidine kinase
LVGLPRNDDLSRAAIVFLQRVNVALLQAGLIAGGLGVLLGLIMARGLTAPLAQLSAAARRISQGKLNQQVAVKGPDEVAGLARAFNDMSAALEKGEQLRRNLVADVAHELRTPLSVIQGNLRAILDDVYTLDKEEVARLYEQTRHLSRLVNDLHELAQAEARQLPLNRQPANLNDLVALTGETFAPVAETKGVSLEMILPAQTISLNVDSTRLRQVLHNLLNNALRHTPKGGRIMLNLEPNSEAINLSVSDTGEGIPPDHLPHIFNRFYRADAVRSRESGGTGLGLAIARAIVEAHNGQISAASSGAPGQGSTFTVTFPIDQAGR